MCAVMASSVAYADESSTIRATVESAQRAGFQKHDLDSYLSLFSQDAVLIAQRQIVPGPYDRRFDRQTIAATKAVTFSGVLRLIDVSFEDVRVTVVKDKAQLSWVVSMGQGDQFTEQVFELYKLRRTKTGWECYENRYFLLGYVAHGRHFNLNMAHWAERDGHVDRATSQANTPLLLGALVEANRFAEAYALIKKLTTVPDVSARQWVQRAVIALQAGAADDAKTSIKRAKAADSTIQVPYWGVDL